MKGKKKQVDFSVRPRKEKETLPADPEQWVREGQEADSRPQKRPTPNLPEGPQKRLTLNLPVKMHTAFKGRCVQEGVTIQDKVRVLIEGELTAARPAPNGEKRPL